MASGAAANAARIRAVPAAAAEDGEVEGDGEGDGDGEDDDEQDDDEEDAPELLSVTAGPTRSTAGAGPWDIPLTARSRSALGLHMDPVGRAAGRQTAALA